MVKMNKKGDTPTGMPSFVSFGLVLLFSIIILVWIFGPEFWAKGVGILLSMGDGKVGKKLDADIPQRFQVPKDLEQSFEDFIFTFENSLKKKDQKCLVPFDKIKNKKDYKISILKEFEGMSMRIIQIEDGRDSFKTTKRYIDSKPCLVEDQNGNYFEVPILEIRDDKINEDSYFDYLFKADKEHICLIPMNGNTRKITSQFNECK